MVLVFQLLSHTGAIYELCTFYLKRFCPVVSNLHLPHIKRDSDKTVHNIKLASA